MIFSRPTLFAFLLSLSSATMLSFPHWATTPSVFAQDQNPPAQREKGEKGRGKGLQDLNLTPEQTRQMQSIRSRYRQQISENSKSLRQARQELQQMLSGNAPEREVRNQYRQVEELNQKLMRLRFDSMLAMREILTPEQRRLFAERMQERRSKSQRSEFQQRREPQTPGS